MHPSTLLFCLSFIVAGVLANKLPGLPDQIYGVNVGCWLMAEPWMFPDEWVKMGGGLCDDCTKCISTEFAFAEAYPDTVDEKFNKHWETWFTQDDVDQLVAGGINTVRIPLGYWIVEALVNRETEFYAKGGILQLQRGLALLKEAGIAVILNHHAVPGVSYPNRVGPGRCTDDVQFYTKYNYHRALIWTAVMTVISHVDPNFGTAVAIQALNQPIEDATQTPDLGEFYANFVKTMRAVEYSLGISDPNTGLPTPDISRFSNVTEALSVTASSAGTVSQVLRDAIPIIVEMASQMNVNLDFDKDDLRDYLFTEYPLVANFMDVNWQRNDPFNPADVADGPQGYDSHIYYGFGGVAAPNEDAYLTSMCNFDIVAESEALRNIPIWIGEWALFTQFEATDEFLKKWADAQKFSYGKGAGWLFWSLKVEDSETVAPLARQWSYVEGLKRGYFTKYPSQFNDPNVCDPYITRVLVDGSSSA